MNNIGTKIKDYISSKGISLTYVANRIGVSVPSFSQKLSGAVKISLEEYLAICRTLDVPFDFFLKEDE